METEILRPTQLTAEDVKRLGAERKYDDIEQARTDGRLDELLGISSTESALNFKVNHTTDQLTQKDVKDLYKRRQYAEIVKAESDGRINYIENGE